MRLMVFVIALLAAFATWHHVSAQASDNAGLSRPVLTANFTHFPWTAGTHADAAFYSATGSTIPMFSYSFVGTKDNTTRSGTMVGTSPFASTLTASAINVVICPFESQHRIHRL
jgi:hypothetical protein